VSESKVKGKAKRKQKEKKTGSTIAPLPSGLYKKATELITTSPFSLSSLSLTYIFFLHPSS